MSTEDDAAAAEKEDQERRAAIIAPLVEAIQQREKFLLADRLDRPFHEIMEDPDRCLIAVAWKKLKTDNGGVAPNFDDLLDMTDAQILDLLGLTDDEVSDEAVDQGKAG